MNINSFLSEVNSVSGVARPNRYTVEINVGSLIQRISSMRIPLGDNQINWFEYFGYEPRDTIRLRMMCKEAELPGMRFATTEIRTYGPEFKLPYVAQYQDMRMQFIVGADMSEKYFFDAWMWSIMNPLSNDANYLKEYATDITISQQDETEYDVYYIKLIDAYPFDVSEMRLSYDDIDSYHLLPVQFAYRKYVLDGMPTDVESMSSTTQYNRGTRERFDETIGRK